MAANVLTIVLNSTSTGALKGISAVSNSISSLQNRLSAVGTYATAALGLGGGIGLGAAAVMASKSIVSLGGNMEQTRIAIGTMVGDLSKANAVIEKMNKFANVTPFNNGEVIKAGKTLLAYGVSAESIQPHLKMIGDIAAGTGKEFTELTAIFGKTFAKGKADSENLNQLAEAGVPIVKTLGDMYGLTGEQIYKMAENGEISASVITAAFQKMSGEGGAFNNMMEKQSQSLNGMWSNITGTLEAVGSTLGEAVAPALKVGLQYVMGWVDELAAMTQDGRAIQYMSTLGMTGVAAGGSIMKSFNYLKENSVAVFKTMQSAVSVVLEGIQAGISGAMAKMIETVIAAINNTIKVFNTVPGLDLKLLETPSIVDNLKQYSKLSKEAGETAAEDLFSNKAFNQAEQNIEKKNSAIDAVMNKLTGGILNWQETQQGIQIRRKLDAASFKDEPVKADPTLKKADSSADKQQNSFRSPSQNFSVDVDRLTKIGGFNFSMAKMSPGDLERNKFLKEIRDLLKSNNNLGGKVKLA